MNGNLTVWTRHRPEAWYGIATLPIFWLTVAGTVLALYSLGKDVRRWYRPPSSSAFSESQAV